MSVRSGQRVPFRETMSRACPTVLLALMCGMVWTPSTLLADSSTLRSFTPEQWQVLQRIHMVLLGGEATTWMDLPGPPYDVGVTIKMKLEQAGFRVTLDPDQAHDALLLVRYVETPGREYRMLEQGTDIVCDLSLRHPTMGTVWNYRLEAATSWPNPAGSLYWDAIRNLEENPYYYYLGELLQGWVRAGEGAVPVFSRMLGQPPSSTGMDTTVTSATARVVANREARLNAIRELGRLHDAQAAGALWSLAERSSPEERREAVTAIGALGDPNAVERLQALQVSTEDAELRAAVEAAIARLQQAR